MTLLPTLSQLSAWLMEVYNFAANGRAILRTTSGIGRDNRDPELG